VFDELFSIIAPVLLIVALGYAWGRSTYRFEAEFVSRLVTRIATPSLVFSTLVELGVGLDAFAEMIFAGLTAMVGFAVVGAVTLKLLRMNLRTYLPTMIFPNGGNLGLPLCLFAFGEAGLALAIAYFTLMAVGQFTIGQWLVSGRASVGLALREPIIYAVGAAILFMWLGAEPPIWVANTVELLGGASIPLLLLSLGVALARFRVRSFKPALIASVLRLGFGFAIGFAVAELFGLDGLARGVLILQSATPAAVFNYLFAERFNQSPEEVAGTIIVSTLIFFLLLPGLLVFLL
jgi:predicted permease